MCIGNVIHLTYSLKNHFGEQRLVGHVRVLYVYN